MLGEILICTLAAAGLLFFAWSLFAWLLLPLPDDTVTILCLTEQTEDLERQIRSFVFLKNSSILRGRLLVADLQQNEQVSALARRLCAEHDCLSYTKETGETAWLNERSN